jgi:hypothetical protein
MQMIFVPSFHVLSFFIAHALQCIKLLLNKKFFAQIRPFKLPKAKN